MVIASKASAVQKNGKVRKGFVERVITMKNGKTRSMYMKISKPKKIKKEKAVKEKKIKVKVEKVKVEKKPKKKIKKKKVLIVSSDDDETVDEFNTTCVELI